MDMGTNLETDASPSVERSSEKITKGEECIREESTCRNSFNKKKFKSKPGSNVTKNFFNISHCSGVHFGPNITIGNVNDRKFRKNNSSKEMEEHIKLLIQNSEPLTEAIIMSVKPEFGGNWRDVFRLLNYSEPEITQAEYLHAQGGIAEIVHQLLLDWKQNKPEEATLGKLASALWNAGEEDAIQRLLTFK